MLSLTPLRGAKGSSPAAYLLEIEDARILLDCGSYEGGVLQDVPESVVNQRREEERAFIERLKEIAPTLTLILLSHPLPSSIGLYPLLATHLKLAPSCIVYASPATLTMGRLALQEWLGGRATEEDSGLGSDAIVSRPDPLAAEAARQHAPWKISPGELANCLARVVTVRFNSPVLLSGRNSPLTLIAARAGHTLGGTLWTLRTPTNDEVFYAPVFNHVKEKTLDGAEIGSTSSSLGPRVRRRAYIVAGAERSLVTAPKTVARSRSILDIVTSTLRSGHSVLIPCDAAARLIELLILLDQHWAFSELSEQFPLCLVSRTGRDLPLALKNMAEFLGTNMQNPQAQAHLKLAQVRFFSSPAELHAAVPPSHPKLVLAAPATMSYGHSRRLFATFATGIGNIVLLTSRGESGSLARWLFERWQGGQTTSAKYGNEAGKIGGPVELAESIELRLNLKRALVGAELQAHMDTIKAKDDAEKKQKALQERSRRLREAAGREDEAESDSSDEEGVGADDDAEDENAMDIGPVSAIPITDDAEAADLPIVRGPNWDEFVDAADNQILAGGSFDTYVRGQVARRLEYSVPAPGAMADDRPIPPARLRIFPFVERRRRVDQYGEVVDVQGWLSRGKLQEAEAATSNAVSSTDFGAQAQAILGKRKRADDEPETAEAPHVFVSETINVQARCTIFVVDLEGKADGRALKTLLPSLNPKKMVLVNGEEDATEDLRTALLSNSAVTRDVFAPSIGEQIGIAEDVKSYSIRLDDTFMDNLDLRKVEGFELTRISGNVAFNDESAIPTISSTTMSLPIAVVNGDGPALAPLYLNPPSATTKTKADAMETDETENELPPLTPSLWIGDLKLAALRRRLNAQGIPAAFAGAGVLVCGPVQSATAAKSASATGKTSAAGGPRDPRRRAAAVAAADAAKLESTPEPEASLANEKVAVRKQAEGHLMIEGSIGETFNAVKAIVYALHASGM